MAIRTKRVELDQDLKDEVTEDDSSESRNERLLVQILRELKAMLVELERIR